MNKPALVLGAIVASSLLFAACGDDDDDDNGNDGTPTAGTTSTSTAATGGTATPAAGEVQVELAEVDGSGVSGEAVISEGATGMVSVAITLDDASFAGDANIHTGSCDDFDDAPAYMLGAVTGGMLETDVDALMDDLEASGHAIVVVSATGTDPVACGEI